LQHPHASAASGDEEIFDVMKRDFEKNLARLLGSTDWTWSGRPRRVSEEVGRATDADG